MPIRNRFAELHPEIAGWRQHLHRHPELMFDTHGTGAFVAERLREFGCDEVVTGFAGGSGVVGIINGRQNRHGRTVGLRADMDALPITEATGLAYASENAGVMHACGHDGHTAMLLGAARYLAETRNFDGRVAVIFQPAEEGGGGGKVMVDEGVLDRWNVAEVYGMHNWPGVALGEFQIRPGPFFAASDEFGLVLEGQGGHAAKPHETIDPVVMSAQLILALQTIASRNADPAGHLVVSVTSLQTDSNAYNVIPPRVRLRGTVRTLTPEMREMAERRLHEVAEGIAATFGGTAQITYRRGYPVMVNHAEETGHAAEAAAAVAGECGEAPLILGGEDFAYMLEARPGAYILLGNGDSAPVHHPEYNFNDEAIPAGCSWWVDLAEARLPL